MNRSTTSPRREARSCLRPFAELAAVLAIGVTVCHLNLKAAQTAQDDRGILSETSKVERGQLSVLFRDNSQSPRVLSGIDALFHTEDAPDFDAFDPDAGGASAGLNFEHVICGHPNPANAFTPRKGKYELFRLPDGASVELARKAADDPWALASTFRYTVREPHYVDFEFRCQSSDPKRFGERGYAVLFFADYMNDVEAVPIFFRGLDSAGAAEKWVRAEAPPGHPDYNTGGTYRSVSAQDLEYDRDHNFKLNLWSYDYPRFSQPFYYGRAARGMAFILMFDRMWTPEDEMRFSLFKFKIPRHPRPAWDFQYVIHQVEKGKSYGFRGRLVWKKFVSEEDCQGEYIQWKRSLSAASRTP